MRRLVEGTSDQDVESSVRRAFASGTYEVFDERRCRNSGADEDWRLSFRALVLAFRSSTYLPVPRRYSPGQGVIDVKGDSVLLVSLLDAKRFFRFF